MLVLRVCRSVLRELKLAHPQNEGGEQWRYLVSVVRQHKQCKDSAALRQQERLLSSYYTYLRSSRRHRELLSLYQGKGERSVEDSAQLVGLRLPENGTRTEQTSSHTSSTSQ